MKKKKRLTFPPRDMSDTIEFDFVQSTQQHDSRYNPLVVAPNAVAAFYSDAEERADDSYAEQDY